MRKFLILAWFAACMGNSLQMEGQFVSRDEATLIATKYLHVIIDKYGPWAGQPKAVARPAEDLFYKGRLIGYYCQVDPDGWIVLSLRREFGGVKASSDKGTFHPENERGTVALIKSRMADHIEAVESRYGSVETASVADVESVLEHSGRQDWDQLASYVPGTNTDAPVVTDNYTEGQILLETEWDQGVPYNNECPDLNCTNPPNGNALVGCVATAGAQILRYWAWPAFYPPNPLDTYDWPNMKDHVYSWSPVWQQDAVAELCHDVGEELNMDYGCGESSAATVDMVGVFILNLYNPDCEVFDRIDYTYPVWFLMIQMNCNSNRPMQYRIGDSETGHSIVCDGWRIYGGSQSQYHMNYGWDDSYSTWYTLDYLHNSDPDYEFMISTIHPNCTLGSTLSGVYPGGYNYVDLDASGSAATFLGGCAIQTLPGMVVKGTGTGGSNQLKFYGNAVNATRIYTDGNQISGIKIYNGGMILQNNGSFRMDRQENW